MRGSELHEQDQEYHNQADSKCTDHLRECLVLVIFLPAVVDPVARRQLKGLELRHRLFQEL
jgi:hypothetical protein